MFGRPSVSKMGGVGLTTERVLTSAAAHGTDPPQFPGDGTRRAAPRTSQFDRAASSDGMSAWSRRDSKGGRSIHAQQVSDFRWLK